MRDIKDYEVKYEKEPCEKYQVIYRRKKVLEILGRYSHRNILEVGCGLEPIFEFFDEYDTMTIVEPGEHFVNNALQKAANRAKKIQCIQGFLEDTIPSLKRIGIMFDCIIVSSLLHEVEYPEKLLRALYTICSEETVIHINVPNANSIHRLLAQKMGLITDIHDLSDLQKTMQRNRVYDLKTLSEAVEMAGFEVLEKGSYFPKFLSAFQMEKLLEEGIVQENIFGGLDQLTEYLPEYGSEIYVQIKKQKE